MSIINFIPERKDIVWLDFDPALGKEIGKYRPALVLSSKAYNIATGLIICSPISTSIRGNQTEVVIGILEKPSVIASSIVQTLAWKERKIKLIARIDAKTYQEVIQRILPLIGAEEL